MTLIINDAAILGHDTASTDDLLRCALLASGGSSAQPHAIRPAAPVDT